MKPDNCASSFTLETTQSYLVDQVAPYRNQMDSQPELLLQGLQGLGKLELLALRVPQIWGGKQVNEATFGEFQELVARYSGALAFLQTQHQSAGGMLAASKNTWLQEKYLPHMGTGKILLGVGFSQLRRVSESLPSSSLSIAQQVEGGYQLNGIIPWITGWGLFTEFIVAATLPDGKAVFAIAPLKNTYQPSGGEIIFSAVADLAAMTATNTVSATLKNFFIPEKYVVSVQPAGWIHENDKKNVLRATFLATGCALAGLDIIAAVAHSKSLPFIHDSFNLLQQELTDCRAAIRHTQTASPSDSEASLQLRAWAIDLAARIAHGAVTVSSGAANYQHHHAQTVYREALVHTVTGQTSQVMQATLSRLTRPQSSPSSKTITYSRVIHLSHIIHENIPQWIGDPPVKFITVAQREAQGYYLRGFSLGEHSATHINAPQSFHSDGIGIDEYPATSLVLPAIVIDITDKTSSNPDYALTVADVMQWESKYGKISPQSLVLLYTGWQNKWNNPSAFMNQDAGGISHFPGFSQEVTQFLLEERQIAGVGIDTHGVEPGTDTTFSVNRLLLSKSSIVLENLTNLSDLPPREITLFIGILRLKGGSGSPAAVMAFIP
ncbi:cyclase family protein [Calothrix sp. 336/3]|uniref:cyclase family protein n=1 Tax=Calothrix sp. 336/3 TaxID=1337936 RepID=UPI0004E31557|nr:cyclase family protein [Calothrix sp. 336/3]AKG23534.1 cyclase [Calothrix sp. 336/3]